MSPLRSLFFLGLCATKIPLLRSFKMNPIKPTEPSNPHAVLAKFAAHVTSASEGAVTDKDLKL